jgi:hypothetical protein
LEIGLSNRRISKNHSRNKLEKMKHQKQIEIAEELKPFAIRKTLRRF